MEIVITTPTNNIEESKNFYIGLDYLQIKDEHLVFADGKNLIEINPDRYARAGVKIYKESWQDEVKDLENKTKVYNLPNGYLLNDFNGCWIYLIEEKFPYENMFDSEHKPITGNFAGLSIECFDFEKSLDIWQIFGFSLKMGNLDSSYIVLQNESGFNISLMKPLSCPHLFFNPSFTYFNGKNNLEVIKKIRELNIPISEEITYFNKEGIVDNIIIRDPGGFGFFLFSD